jgi:hypothetical protein
MELHEEHHDKDDIRKWTLLSKLYKIADVLDVPVLRNKIVDILLEDMRTTLRKPGVKIISIVYTFTPAHSQLRKVLADHYMREPMGPTFLKMHWENLPTDFFVDLAVGWSSVGLNRRKLKAPTNAGRCAYHYHDGNVLICE